MVTDFYPKLTFDLFESSGNLPRMFWPLLHTTRDDYDSRSEWQLMRDPMADPMYVHYRLKTWDQYNDRLLNNARFGGYLITNRGGTALIDSITLGSRTPSARMAAVYRYMQRNFTWNGVYDMLAGDDFDDFLKRGTGSSAQLNLLLVNLLQRAGIQAEPLLVRTNDLGQPQKMYPIRYQFNHVIATAEVEGTRVMLDLTSGSSDLSRLNRKDINTEAWIVSSDVQGWVEIYQEGTREGEEPVSNR
jgi:transglutaminase-like putative cysteine protease